MPAKDLFGPPPTKQEFAAAEMVVEGKLTLAEISQRSGIALDKIKAIMSVPAIRGYFAKHLDDAGATLESSAKVIAEAQRADNIVVSNRDGDVNLVNAGPDHAIRLKAAELNLKARGELKDGGTSVNLFMDLSDAQLADIAAGKIDPAALIDTGPRITNPAIETSAS